MLEHWDISSDQLKARMLQQAEGNRTGQETKGISGRCGRDNACKIL